MDTLTTSGHSLQEQRRFNSEDKIENKKECMIFKGAYISF